MISIHSLPAAAPRLQGRVILVECDELNLNWIRNIVLSFPINAVLTLSNKYEYNHISMH